MGLGNGQDWHNLALPPLSNDDLLWRLWVPLERPLGQQGLYRGGHLLRLEHCAVGDASHIPAVVFVQEGQHPHLGFAQVQVFEVAFKGLDELVGGAH